MSGKATGATCDCFNPTEYCDCDWRAEVERLREDSMRYGDGHQYSNAEYTSVRNRAEKAEAKLAEAREALKAVVTWNPQWLEAAKKVRAALSADGKGEGRA